MMSEDETREHQQSEKARRANRIFEKHIRPELESNVSPRAFVAIDLESRDFEVDDRKLAAADRLVERRPEAKGKLWFRRVGSPVAYHIGGRLPHAGDFHSKGPKTEDPSPKHVEKGEE